MVQPDLRRAFRYVVPYWPRLLVVVALSLVGTALSLYLPYLSKLLVDRALIGRDLLALRRVVLLFGGITLLSFGLNVASGLVYTRVSAAILFDMRVELLRHLQRLSPRFYVSVPLGQIASRLNNDIGEIQRVASEVLLAWIGNVLYLAGTVAILWALDAYLFAVSLGVLPLALIALIRFRRRLEGAIAAMRDRSATIGTFLLETLLGMKLVVALNRQEHEVGRFHERNDAFVSSLIQMQRLSYLSGGIPGLLLSAGSLIVFLVGGARVIHGAISMGTLVAFVAYQMRIFGPVQGLMGLYTSIATVRVSLRRVNELLDAPVEVEDAPDARPLATARGHLAFHGVTFSFDREGPVLDDVSLSIEAGERVAIVGPSGGGKSTIADLLARQLDPARGQVTLDGHDLRSVRLRDIRRLVVVVDQEPYLFNVSIAENIRFGRPDATDAGVAGAAQAAGLGELLGRLPQGIATLAGERGRALSAGERQRVAIARALLADPAVLVLDEATSALDPAVEAQIVSSYDAAMRGRTTIVISHRLELVRRATRVLMIDSGHIVAEGAPDELAFAEGPFARLFAVSRRLV